MGVGEHRLEVADGLGLHGVVEGVTPTLTGIGQDIGVVGTIQVVAFILQAVVRTGEMAGDLALVDIPVHEAGAPDGLVEHAFSGHGEREGGRELQVEGEGALPDLRHVEVGIDGVDVGALADLAILRGDGGVQTQGLDVLLVIGDQVTTGLLAAVQGDQRGLDIVRILDSGDLAIGILGEGRGVLGGSLDHTGILRHVREEHERETALEQAGTAADDDALVTIDIPVEAHARGNLDAGLGPHAGIDALAAEADGLDGVVGHQVLVVEGEHVGTEAVGELEVAGELPFILHIGAVLVVVDSAGRVGDTVVTVGVDEAQGQVTLEEVLGAGEAVVTGTVTHVGVVSHLVLVGGASGKSVGTQVEGQVVLHVENRVLHTVVVGEELVTEGGIRDEVAGAVVTVGHDVDVRERAGLGTALVVDVGVGRNEAVGNRVGETAVELAGDGPDIILLAVHVVGERLGLLAGTVETLVAVVVIAGVAVRSIPVAIRRVVVAEAELVGIGDVPVNAGQELAVLRTAGIAVEGTRIVAVFVLELVSDLVEDTGLRGIGTDLDLLFRLFLHFEVHEEEELVLHDRATEGEAVDEVGLRLAVAQILAPELVATESLVGVIGVGRTLEGVGTGLGDGVDAAAHEVGLTDVIGSHDQLDLLDGVEGNRGAAAREGVGEAEVVVQVRTVHGEVRGTAVGTGEAHAAGVRAELGEGGKAAARVRQVHHLLVGDVGAGAGLGGGEAGGRSGHDDGLVQGLDIVVQITVQDIVLTEGELDVRELHGLVAEAGNLHDVRTAGTHTLDRIEAFPVGHGTVGGTGGGVGRHDGGADDGLTLGVHDAAAEGGGGHLGKGDNARHHHSDDEQKAFESVLHK